MPGVVEKLLVSVGQAVETGDTLCTVSAMKMEVTPIAFIVCCLHSMS
jgi:biotin carboxyl carrier protein